MYQTKTNETFKSINWVLFLEGYKIITPPQKLQSEKNVHSPSSCSVIQSKSEYLKFMYGMFLVFAYQIL